MIISPKFKWLSLILVGILTLSIILTGCTSTTTPTPTATATSQPSATPTAKPSATPTVSQLSGTVTESGSTTVQPLAELFAEEFMAKNPNVKVVIQGGGSGVGIKAANDGTVDIGAASRELTAADPALVKHILARDGIAIIVNPQNTVTNLTKAQVKDIFSGKITNWKDVGGADKTINVAAREEGSGTRTAFDEMVLGKDTRMSERAILQSSNGALSQVVKGDVNAVGFISFGYLDASLKAVSIDGVAATEANAKSGTYPIVRPLYFLTKAEPAGVVKAFLDYCKGPEAQAIVTKEGYVSVN